MFIWQIPHFLALAMKRVDEYRNAGIPMLPVVHGFEITKTPNYDLDSMFITTTILYEWTRDNIYGNCNTA